MSVAAPKPLETIRVPYLPLIGSAVAVPPGAIRITMDDRDFRLVPDSGMLVLVKQPAEAILPASRVANEA